MLRLTDNGAIITLAGKAHRDKLFLYNCLLMAAALIVIVISVLAPAKIALGAMFALGCGCFFWNRYRQSKPSIVINAGELTLEPYKLSHKKITHTLSAHAVIQDSEEELHIVDGKTIVIQDFADVRHKQVAHALLTGQPIGKRLVNIKLQS